MLAHELNCSAKTGGLAFGVGGGRGARPPLPSGYGPALVVAQ